MHNWKKVSSLQHAQPFDVLPKWDFQAIRISVSNINIFLVNIFPNIFKIVQIFQQFQQKI